ncbi:HpcH/HpaI aldolase/citrate lyase family protein [Candidatus Bipolaricaulota bacterium]
MSVALKEALAENQVIIGTFLLELSSPSIPRILANAGFDFVVIDMEHGLFTMESAATLIAFARTSGISPLVRVAEITRTNVLRVLEAGACGIVAPMIDNSKDVDELYRLAKYPPAGQRGTCLGTAHTDYRIPDPTSYLQEANKAVLLVGQIETKEALANLDEILSSGKLDIVFVGPLDLSVSLGVPGNLNTPEFDAATQAILDCCDEHNAVVGAFAADPDTARRWIERGVRMIACSAELLMLSDMSRQVVEAIRKG